jgi:hypothetical protein
LGDDTTDAGEQLAQWLKEAGQRAGGAARAPAGEGDDSFNSPASLHRYLEQLAGRQLKSHADVLDYLRQVAGTNPRQYRDQERRRMVREIALLLLLSLSYLHYYYWEVQVEIAKLNSLRIFVPATVPGERRA